MSNKTKNGLSLCVVCGKPMLDNNDCFSMGSDGYRHKKCRPGSSAWKAKYGESEITKLLSGKKAKTLSPKATTKADPLYKACAALVARWKYLRYMNTVYFLQFPVVCIDVNGNLVEMDLSNEPPTVEVLYAKLK